MNISTKLDISKLEKSIKNAAVQKIKQNPIIVEKKLVTHIQNTLKNFKDETGLKPEIKINVANTSKATNGINLTCRVSVLNGDDDYKERVLTFLRSNK